MPDLECARCGFQLTGLDDKEKCPFCAKTPDRDSKPLYAWNYFRQRGLLRIMDSVDEILRRKPGTQRGSDVHIRDEVQTPVVQPTSDTEATDESFFALGEEPGLTADRILSKGAVASKRAQGVALSAPKFLLGMCVFGLSLIVAVLLLIPSENHNLMIAIYGPLHSHNPFVATAFWEWWLQWSIRIGIVFAFLSVATVFYALISLGWRLKFWDIR